MRARLTDLCPWLPRWAGTRKVKPIWILLKQETVSGSGISWAICKSAHHSRQITTLAPPPLSFYRPDALPAAQPTVSKQWRQTWTKMRTVIVILIIEYKHCRLVPSNLGLCVLWHEDCYLLAWPPNLHYQSVSKFLKWPKWCSHCKDH